MVTEAVAERRASRSARRPTGQRADGRPPAEGLRRQGGAAARGVPAAVVVMTPAEVDDISTEGGPATGRCRPRRGAVDDRIPTGRNATASARRRWRSRPTRHASARSSLAQRVDATAAPVARLDLEGRCLAGRRRSCAIGAGSVLVRLLRDVPPPVPDAGTGSLRAVISRTWTALAACAVLALGCVRRRTEQQHRGRSRRLAVSRDDYEEVPRQSSPTRRSSVSRRTSTPARSPVTLAAAFCRR